MKKKRSVFSREDLSWKDQVDGEQAEAQKFWNFTKGVLTQNSIPLTWKILDNNIAKIPTKSTDKPVACIYIQLLWPEMTSALFTEHKMDQKGENKRQKLVNKYNRQIQPLEPIATA